MTNAGGALKPGDAPAVLTITGDLTESQPSALDILLGGTTPGTGYSQLIVDGLGGVRDCRPTRHCGARFCIEGMDEHVDSAMDKIEDLPNADLTKLP